jgi:hypothetical protein
MLLVRLIFEYFQDFTGIITLIDWIVTSHALKVGLLASSEQRLEKSGNQRPEAVIHHKQYHKSQDEKSKQTHKNLE